MTKLDVYFSFQISASWRNFSGIGINWDSFTGSVFEKVFTTHAQYSKVSKAVWNFSQNLSVLVNLGFPL